MAKIEIIPDFNMKDVSNYMENYKDHIKDKAVAILSELADSSAEHLRSNAEFFNHSFNLRSSLGAIVFKDGNIVHENFKLLGGGNEGLAKAKEVAHSNFPKEGIGMMLVAGEDYALYVEVRSNKWVISGSSMRLAKILQGLL